jgi:hypothetical protein
MVLLTAAARCPGDADDAAVANAAGVTRQWIESGARVRTLVADFQQERVLRTLRKPLTRPGRLWVDRQSGGLRMDIGEPPAARLLKTPGKDEWWWADLRAGRSKLIATADLGEADPAAPWMMLFGSSGDWEQFSRILEPVSAEPLASAAEWWRVLLRPAPRAGAGHLRTLTIDIHPATGGLSQAEMLLRDQSRLRLRLGRAEPHKPVPAAVFQVAMPPPRP